MKVMCEDHSIGETIYQTITGFTFNSSKGS